MATAARAHNALLWDVFCRVIDNHGDLGVCWRLSRQLAARGQRVRLWVDDARALAWMAPEAAQDGSGDSGGSGGVAVLPWAQACDAAALRGLPAADVWVEAFGCDIPAPFTQHFAKRFAKHFPARAHAAAQPVWLNLEYLSAEDWVPRMHALPSPVLHGAAAGWQKWFFYPGFTAQTGGLLREPGLAARQQAFDRRAWLRGIGVPLCEGAPPPTLISLFCYEPPALAGWLLRLAESAQPSHLLVTAGRAAAAVQKAMQKAMPKAAQENTALRAPNGRMPLQISYLPYLPQTEYDHLLWACDVNFVRGEDSLVRALWAGRPFVWNIYPQPEDNAHHAKLDAFLDWLQAPESLRRFHRHWNGLPDAPDAPAHAARLPLPGQAEWAVWAQCAASARQRLLAQRGLCGQLLDFVRARRGAATAAPAADEATNEATGEAVNETADETARGAG